MPGEGFMSSGNSSLKNNRNLNSRDRRDLSRFSKNKTKRFFEFKRDEEALKIVRQRIERNRKLKKLRYLGLFILFLLLSSVWFYYLIVNN